MKKYFCLFLLFLASSLHANPFIEFGSIFEYTYEDPAYSPHLETDDPSVPLGLYSIVIPIEVGYAWDSGLLVGLDMGFSLGLSSMLTAQQSFRLGPSVGYSSFGNFFYQVQATPISISFNEILADIFGVQMTTTQDLRSGITFCIGTVGAAKTRARSLSLGFDFNWGKILNDAFVNTTSYSVSIGYKQMSIFKLPK